MIGAQSSSGTTVQKCVHAVLPSPPPRSSASQASLVAHPLPSWTWTKCRPRSRLRRKPVEPGHRPRSDLPRIRTYGEGQHVQLLRGGGRADNRGQGHPDRRPGQRHVGRGVANTLGTIAAPHDLAALPRRVAGFCDPEASERWGPGAASSLRSNRTCVSYGRRDCAEGGCQFVIGH